MKVKILVLAEVTAGGEWIANQRLIEAVKKKSGNHFEFYLIGFTDKKQSRLSSFQKSTLFPHSTAKRPFSFIKKLILDYLSARKRIKEAIANQEFDYYWVAYYFMTLPLLSLPLISKNRIIYAFHGTRGLFFKKVININYRELIIRVLEFLSLNSINTIITDSKEAENFLRRVLGIFSKKKKFFVLENSVPEEFFKIYSKTKLMIFKNQLKIPKQSRIILYSGRMTKYKGLENLVVAFNRIVRKIKNVSLVIAYPTCNKDGNVLGVIEDKIKKANTQKHVKFVKDLKQSQLISLYQISDVLILPSEIEMAPLVVIEAFACGIPCIGTKTGNMPSLISQIDSNLILDGNHPQEIYKKLIYFLNIPKNKARKIKDKARMLAKNFSYKNQAKKFIELIDYLDNSNAPEF